ncbi:uncharacterized protein [Drosophila pseudoobscura]|uniref:EFHB C-terminal EF-hand domain-containing protein n=1 Tax=Drosophila pseudoobscura pseudoobscura TaxID=46245 RepID=A0A6I8W6Z2_DROPS|nr:uncharacterized protein LOC6900790 [Drosophila pseudoobscura]
MSNIGRFVDRNADIRAAGLTTSFGDLVSVPDCMPFTHPSDLAEQLMRQECRRSTVKQQSKRNQIVPSDSMEKMLNGEEKSRFVAFREKLYEAMYSKKHRLGRIRPTHSKPESVTNDSRTFGMASTTSEPLYPIILPPKSAEQVNQEYAEFHDKHIISHNHYFPSEIVNRKYTHPFDRRNTFGMHLGTDRNGTLVKSVLSLFEGPDLIINKTHNDFIERHCGPLGKKYKHPYEVPDIIHGITHPFECDAKMLFENISPCLNNNRLKDALRYLIVWRRSLHKRPDFHIYDLCSVLEKKDKELTGHLPLSKIIETLDRLHIVVDTQKMRTALNHFHLIIDEGCATERVSYEKFCDLVGQQVPLPTVESRLPFPAKMYCLDTTYRLFCADRNKKPVEGLVEKKKFLTHQEQDEENTRAKDLIAPEPETLYGLGPSDFTRPRPKDQMERLFKNVLPKDDFETVWQRVLAEHKDPHEMVSVYQFRTVWKRIQDIAALDSRYSRS